MACCPTEAKYGYDDSRFEKAVDDHFHCSICYNVLKEPMMCRNNEHLFCRGCITEHLNTNLHTCPECNEDLTVETLRRARLANNILSGLKIKCDYSQRGCQEYIRLEELDSHVEHCGFAPVKCSNEECEMIVNKREIIYHESTVCEYRKVKCHNCEKIEQDVEEMKEKIDEKMKEMKEKMEGMDKKIEERLDGMNKKVEGLAVDVDEVKGLMFEMFEKLRFLENTMQYSSAMNYLSTSLMQDILVSGGCSGVGNYLKSVERFSWKKLPVRWGDQAVLIGGYGNGQYSKKVFMYHSKTGSTIELSSMLEERNGCAAVITGNTIVVMGGRGRSGRVRSVEAFTLGGYSWRYLPAMNDIRTLATATVLPTKSIH